MPLPAALTINAWTGPPGAADGALGQGAAAWALGRRPYAPDKFLKPQPDADPSDWRDARVGWGVVLPERPGVSQQDHASGADAPEAIRTLLTARGDAPVLRYRSKWKKRLQLLRNYRTGKDIDVTGSATGVGTDGLPGYLLIYGSPADVPWELQYRLNGVCNVGRLDLTGEALENYVGALLKDFKDAEARVDQAVVWAVDQGPADITRLMRDAIAQKVLADLRADPDIAERATFLDGSTGPATGATLEQALRHQRPAFILTTSHGQTGPLNDQPLMAAQLGLPVDQEHEPVTAGSLLAEWQPDGAIWYAHACCSAGGDSTSLFTSVVNADSLIAGVLKGVASLGARVAPLPTALLGAKKPLRAFIGHVEPTFDWTLRQPATGQHLTDTIRRALYNRLFSSVPVGLAFRGYYDRMGPLYVAHDHAIEAFNRGEDVLDTVLYTHLTARDIQSMVILGDPTAALPTLGGTGTSPG
jgi:hypothetical protein